MKMNLNDKIACTLTPLGWEYYNKECKYKPTQDEAGRCEFSLWEFANIFGQHLFCGSLQVVRDNEIEILPTDS